MKHVVMHRNVPHIGYRYQPLVMHMEMPPEGNNFISWRLPVLESLVAKIAINAKMKAYHILSAYYNHATGLYKDVDKIWFGLNGYIGYKAFQHC